MRLMLFVKLSVLFSCLALLFFALTDAAVLSLLKMVAGGVVVSVAISAVYPEMRGIRKGDAVSVVTGNALPAMLGRLGVALDEGKRQGRIKVRLDNGNEVLGVVESYEGILSPPRIKIVYEERLVE